MFVLLFAIGVMTTAPSAQDRTTPPQRPGRSERLAVSALQDPAKVPTPLGPSPRPSAPIDQEHSRSTWSDGWKRLHVESRGRIELTDDERDIKRISPDGYFELSSRGWLSLFGRRYTVRGNADGTTTRRFSLGASEHPIDVATRRWIGDTIQRLVAGGFGAETRVTRILSQQGASGVLDAISLLSGDFIKAKYYRILLAQTPLDRPTAARLLRQAGHEIGSDFELARVLTSFIQTVALDDAIAPAFVEASSGIDSDFERSRLLRTLLASQRHMPALVSVVLTSSSSIGSDFEKTRVLQDLAGSRDLDEAAVLGLIRTTGSIGSDFEKSRILRQIVAGQPLDAVSRAALLDTAGHIGSDHERGRVLSALLQGGALP
jgi:hypothetical protein